MNAGCSTASTQNVDSQFSVRELLQQKSIEHPTHYDGFRFEILRVTCNEYPRKNPTGYRLHLWSRTRDISDRRVVTFGHSLKLVTAIDQDGKDLDPTPWSRPKDPYYIESFSFPGLAASAKLKNWGYFSDQFGEIRDLAQPPKRLSLLRGYVRVLEAKDFKTHVLPIQVTGEWVEIDKGLRLRFDGIDYEDDRTILRWTTYTDLPPGPTHFEYYQRWYEFQILDASNKNVPWRAPGQVRDDSGYTAHTAYIAPNLNISELSFRYLVAGRLETYRIPFEYYDVPVPYETANMPPMPPDDGPHRSKNK